MAHAYNGLPPPKLYPGAHFWVLVGGPLFASGLMIAPAWLSLRGWSRRRARRVHRLARGAILGSFAWAAIVGLLFATLNSSDAGLLQRSLEQSARLFSALEVPRGLLPAFGGVALFAAGVYALSLAGSDQPSANGADGTQ